MTDTNHYKKKNIYDCEILAPAGSYDAMLAAFNAGADACYLGGTMFGARANANNFDQNELIRAIEYAHIHGKKIYLTVNTLLKDNEINKNLYEYLLPYYQVGLDAVIVQDLGVLKYIRERFKDLPIHCSTQMTITGPNYARELMKLGVSRIVTPRELSFKEINEIYKATNLEIESFVHGALCYCYSGQCLLSSMIGGRSGNRGKCAQPCRLPYSLKESDIRNKYLLSPKDMCTLNILPDILASGVYSLKIEGRMKKPEYVASVVAVYRKYVDLLKLNGPDKYEVQQSDIEFLKEFYNRGGFTDGFYNKQNSPEMMTIDRPNHMGVSVGKTGKVSKNSIELIFDKNITKGDVLEIGNNMFNFFAPDDINKGTVYIYKSKDISQNMSNRIINRTSNMKLSQYVSDRYIKTNKNEMKTLIKNISCDLNISLNSPIKAKVYDDVISIDIEGPVPMSALNKPITKDTFLEKFMKTGGTRFNFENINIDIEDGLFMPVGMINEFRRYIIDEFRSALINKYKKQIEKEDEENKQKVENKYFKLSEETNNLYILVSTSEQLDEVLKYEYVNNVIIEYADIDKQSLNEIIERLRNKDIFVYIALPYISRNKMADEMENDGYFVSKLNVDGFVYRNLESFFMLKKYISSDKRVIFDNSIYAYNNYDITLLHKIGADYLTVSYENNINEISKFEDKSMLINIYGYIPVMISAGCIMKTTGQCKYNEIPHIHTISDRMSNEMKIKCVCRYCYNIIYNIIPQSLIQNINEINDMGMRNYKINFTTESANEVALVLDAYKEYISGNPADIKYASTKGHFKRGVE